MGLTGRARSLLQFSGPSARRRTRKDALFFNQLAPAAKKSILAAGSRREMIRRHWRDSYSSQEGYYGLGMMSGRLGDWEWFGHSGGFQGCLTRTAMFPVQNVCISVLTNASDGPSHIWLAGAMHIARVEAVEWWKEASLSHTKKGRKRRPFCRRDLYAAWVEQEGSLSWLVLRECDDRPILRGWFD